MTRHAFWVVTRIVLLALLILGLVYWLMVPGSAARTMVATVVTVTASVPENPINTPPDGNGPIVPTAPTPPMVSPEEPVSSIPEILTEEPATELSGFTSESISAPVSVFDPFRTVGEVLWEREGLPTGAAFIDRIALVTPKTGTLAFGSIESLVRGEQRKIAQEFIALVQVTLLFLAIGLLAALGLLFLFGFFDRHRRIYVTPFTCHPLWVDAAGAIHKAISRKKANVR